MTMSTTARYSALRRRRRLRLFFTDRCCVILSPVRSCDDSGGVERFSMDGA